MTTMTETLIAEAAEAHAEYPHYVGHWDGWVTARITRNLRSRGAAIANKNELVLINPKSFTTPESPDVIEGWRMPGYVTAYLPKNLNGCDTSIKAKDVEVL
jgi:hypothetical protein